MTESVRTQDVHLIRSMKRREIIVYMSRCGVSNQDIAEDMGLSRQRISYVLRNEKIIEEYMEGEI